MSATAARLVCGCMSGTSLDGLDAVLARVEGRGLDLRARPLRSLGRAYEPALAAELRRLSGGEPCTLERLTGLALELGRFHLGLLRDLLGSDKADLAVLHGQTLFHRPPLSLQLLNPAPVAHGLACPVVYDLRAADLACGGQGAPITPLADLLLYAAPEEWRTVVNLGGFCNFTVLPPCAGDRAAAAAEVRGRDLCACNQLLDAVARAALGRPYDEDGRAAAAGSVNPSALEDLRAALEHQALAGRSLGSGDELWNLVPALARRLAGPDLARTACRAVALAVAAHTGRTDRLVLAGGGSANPALVTEIRAATPAPVVLSDDLGVPYQDREALAMAVLGALCQDRVPVTLPRVTGCRGPAPVSGCWVLP